MTKTVIELVVVALASLAAGRVVLRPVVFREIRARPLLSLAALGVAGAILLVVARTWPGWRAALAVAAPVAAALWVLFYLRSRPHFGRSRGLPPGSLGLGVSLDAIGQPAFYARAAERWGPIFKMAQFHRPTVAVVDLPLGLAFMERERAKLAQPRLPFGRLSPGNYIEFMNDAQHTRYRGILRPALSGPVVAASRPGVAEVVRHQLATMADANQLGGVDPDPYLDRIAFASLTRVMFGVAVTDPRVPDLERQFGALGTARAFAERRPEERREPFSRLIEIVRALGTDIFSAPGASGPESRSVLGEILRHDAAHLADETLVGNLILMVHVTRSNVRGLLGWVLKEACDHPLGPEWEAATAAMSAIEGLATNFVNETLRLHQSEYFYREVVSDVGIGPYRIPKGWLVRVCVRECHDRPDVFPDPARFDPSRFAGRQYSREEYAPFSDGTHSCFGAGLAVMIAKTLVVALATEFEVRKVADGPVVRQGNRHWSHWRPSLAFRVALSHRKRVDALGA
ncbi:MAG: cytochrome P450 [Gemmatimonadales bacterium]